jgi:hypothetical protein
VIIVERLSIIHQKLEQKYTVLSVKRDTKRNQCGRDRVQVSDGRRVLPERQILCVSNYVNNN